MQCNHITNPTRLLNKERRLKRHSHHVKIYCSYAPPRLLSYCPAPLWSKHFTRLCRQCSRVIKMLQQYANFQNTEDHYNFVGTSKWSIFNSNIQIDRADSSIYLIYIFFQNSYFVETKYFIRRCVKNALIILRYICIHVVYNPS